MKAIIQRVKNASVTVENELISEIGNGLLILLGVYENDTKSDIDILAKKCSDIRIFTDENDKMNLSVKDINGSILVISNFTLCADTKKGNRPSFTKAMAPKEANEFYLEFCEKLKDNGVDNVLHGIFGAEMKVSLLNDGPITIDLDTSVWRKNAD